MDFTEENRKKLIEYLSSHHIPKGLGTEDEACSLAAINLAISGKLTDEIPECMSLIIGKFLILLQDEMPDNVRNSFRYKSVLVQLAGTGRNKDLERRRFLFILDWMWSFLPEIQPIADTYDFGEEWCDMVNVGIRLNSKLYSSASTSVPYKNAILMYRLINGIYIEMHLYNLLFLNLRDLTFNISEIVKLPIQNSLFSLEDNMAGLSSKIVVSMLNLCKVLNISKSSWETRLKSVELLERLVCVQNFKFTVLKDT